jgi:4-methyl-5(b-hydroxyethyl)-thiazole monophosphate biosynthesis
MKKVYVLLAEGFETVEALAQVDACKRCKIDVSTISIDNQDFVTSSHGIQVKADKKWDDANFDEADVLVLPGGYPGYMNLASSEAVGKVVKQFYNTQKLVAAICGAPYVLAANGLAKDREVTYHHSIKDKMEGYHYTGDRVTIDGNLITGIGAGRSFDFAIAYISQIADKDTIAHLKGGLEIND